MNTELLTPVTYVNGLGETRTIDASIYRAEWIANESGHSPYATLEAWARDNDDKENNGYTAAVRIARAIRQEAYDIDAQVSTEPTPTSVVEPPAMTLHIGEEVHDLTEFGPVTDDKLGKLRKLVEERNAARAEVETLKQEQLSMWVKAAKEADARDYCSVYDGIATAAGAPTRDELREQGLLTVDYVISVDISYRATFTVTADSASEAEDYVYSLSAQEIADRSDVLNTEPRDFGIRSVDEIND